MISKNKAKLIRSLEQKKYRKESQLFIAEGHKLVEDLLPAFECIYIAARKEWIESRKDDLKRMAHELEIHEVCPEELQKISLQKSPQDVLAIFRQRSHTIVPEQIIAGQLCLGLDGVQDPGNLGTIVRIADWFGIEHIFCSLDTADIYNPKSVQATMGAMARVQVHYLPLKELILKQPTSTPVYGTFLDGEDIYRQDLTSHGLIIMGNEGKGVSPEVSALMNKRLYIPNYPPERETSESLNVAVATAIICAEFRRQAAKP